MNVTLLMSWDAEIARLSVERLYVDSRAENVKRMQMRSVSGKWEQAGVEMTVLE